MSNSGDYRPIPETFDSLPRPPGDGDSSSAGGDPQVPLHNLSMVRARMDSLQHFLSDSVNGNTLLGKRQMEMVSSEISAAIRGIIVNGAALLACSQTPEIAAHQPREVPKPAAAIEEAAAAKPPKCSDAGDDDANLQVGVANSATSISGDLGEADLKIEAIDEDDAGGGEWDIIELDAVELLAEHVHFCEICGKGFKRDANLRMHMRAHGNQFKTPEALAKPAERPPAGAGGDHDEDRPSGRPTRFSCPFLGCNRNRSHKKFRPLKSVICVKNHFKRSHCPKMYSCNRCNRKSFSVLADLKSHLKHCGESKWRCTCGTSFSRKDKLFGHMALFEGHMPAVAAEEEEEKGKEVAASATVMVEDEEDEDVPPSKEMEFGWSNCSDNGLLFDGLLEGFGSIDNYCLQDILDSANEFRGF